MRPIVTQEDKKLVGHLVKKKKQAGKHVHVYYNRKTSTGTSTYLTGKYYSVKNKKYVTYRSSYELRFFHMLEEDKNVVSYEVESVKVPYKDLDGKFRNYIPDAIVSYKDGSIRICEIKPEAMLDNVIVKRKAQACKTYFKKLFEGIDLDYRYEFITEKHLFKTPTEYSLFIQEHSK